ncbi:MAG: hypothetical protein ACREDM_11235 [Methylocella sp.]
MEASRTRGLFRAGAAARLAALTPPGHQVFIHVTLTDEYPLAQAQVIIEAIATAGGVEAAQLGDMV